MHDLKRRTSILKERFDSYAESIDLSEKRKRQEVLTMESAEEGLWDDQERARAIMQELGDISAELERVDALSGDIATLVELAEEEELSSEFEEEISSAEGRLAKLEFTTYLSGKYDKKGAIVSIHAGQGGTEAMDWVSMLFRMYMRYCESKSWGCDVIAETPGEEAGLKSVTFRVRGNFVYGYLKREAGTHRLVRQSPFNADNLRQTSFAQVEVLPELLEEDRPDIDIKDEDLEWQFFRASSQGGQNVQKVSTAVRLIHKPTNIIVTAQTERFQVQNRKNALDLLRAKLWSLEEERRNKEEKTIKGDYITPSWGTQIRSYVLHPYKMVKDLRTEYETGDTEAVLDGQIDAFIEAELKL